ncbi:MAG: Ig-like domain-containing protein [Cyanobacteria bacterium J06598_1]
MFTQQETVDADSDGVIDLINTYTFDENNALTSLGMDYNADGSSDIIYTYTYDPNGDLTSELTSFSIFRKSGSNPLNTNINGNATTAPLTYNVSTEVNRCEDRVHEAIIVIDDANGERARISINYIKVEPNDEVRIFTFNEKGQLVNLLYTRGLTVTNLYDDNGRVVEEIWGDFADNPNRDLSYIYEYDDFGNLAREYFYNPGNTIGQGEIFDLSTYIRSSDAINDAVTTVEDSVITGDVFIDNGDGADRGSSNGGDLFVTEVNGLSSSVGSQITLPSGALLTLKSNGTFAYAPNGQFDELSGEDSTTDSFTYTADSGNGLSDTATVTVTITGTDEATATPFWFSPDKDVAVGEAEDIIFFDGNDFSVLFDGSDVGLNARIDAFDIISETEILMSFHRDFKLNGLAIDDSDVVKFTAESLGEAGTAGKFERYLTGRDLGLTRGSEDIDALISMEDGSLLFSTAGSARMTGNLRSKDEDLVRFDPLTGELSLYFDGSDAGLGNQGGDVNALGMLDGDLILSTAASFKVGTITGKDEDVVRYRPTSIGAQTSGVFEPNLVFDGSTVGFGGDIAAIDLNIG